MLLLTVAGRTSGLPRTTPVSYFEHDGGYLVVGSGGGSPAEPQWMRNLRAASRAHVQIRARHLDVDVRMAQGEERDTLWRDVVVRRAPAFAAYEPKSGRTMPIAVLTPVTGRGPADPEPADPEPADPEPAAATWSGGGRCAAATSDPDPSAHQRHHVPSCVAAAPGSERSTTARSGDSQVSSPDGSSRPLRSTASSRTRAPRCRTIPSARPGAAGRLRG